MILCVAEKPSVAKDIAEILGARSRKDGYWEGNGYWVSWTFGHLCTLKDFERLSLKLGFSILERATFNDQREVKFLAGWRSTLAAYRFTAERHTLSRTNA